MAKTDEKTLELIKEVNRQKKEIEKAERPNWITKCSFQPLPAAPINLHVETDVGTLIGIVAYLQMQEKHYNEAAAALGIADPPAFSWAGFSVKDWTDDVKSRIGKVQISAKKRKLEALESRLNQIISPELRAQLEIEAIEKDLK